MVKSSDAKRRLSGCCALTALALIAGGGGANGRTETVLYSFQNNGADGTVPQAKLIDVKGVLYGTTYFGGAYNDGTVFSLNLSTNAETVLHSFGQNGEDGIVPVAGLIGFHGNIYGTTVSGGVYGLGTAYSINPSTGVEAVLHSFGNDDDFDGLGPFAGLINVDGVMYGTTIGGGQHQSGSIFSIDPSTGAENVIYSFCAQANCPDGAGPQAGLIDVSGTLYGTTTIGGAAGACGGSQDGCGAVFSFNLATGRETTLYKFQNNGADGIFPVAGLTSLQGGLYGTTVFGGASNVGTVFSVNPSTGAESVLHAFKINGADCESPYGGLFTLRHRLYGDTAYGGDQNAGTIFRIKP